VSCEPDRSCYRGTIFFQIVDPKSPRVGLLNQADKQRPWGAAAFESMRCLTTAPLDGYRVRMRKSSMAEIEDGFASLELSTEDARRRLRELESLGTSDVPEDAVHNSATEGNRNAHVAPAAPRNDYPG
jgi:hypothetical protein